jgi:hypothetical protein
MRKASIRYAVVLSVAGAMLAASCGGDDGTAADTTPAAAVETTVEVTTTATTAPSATTVAPATTLAPTTTTASTTATTVKSGTVTTKSTASATTKATTATTAATTATTAATTATTTAVKPLEKFQVMIIGDETSTIGFPVKESVAALKAGLKDIPQAEVLNCDTKSDVNLFNACQRDAVSKKVSAVVISFVPSGDSSIVSNAGIPVVGNADPTRSTSFVLNNGNASYTGMGKGFVKNGCKKLGVLAFEGSEALVAAIDKGAKSEPGGSAGVISTAYIAPTAPDLSPAIGKLTGAGVDCIALSVAPPNLIQAVVAISQSGSDARFGSVSAIWFPGVIAALGARADGALLFDMQQSPQDTNSPGVQKVQADMAAIDPSAKISTIATIAWASGKMMGEAARRVGGTITAETLTAAMNNLGTFDIMEGVYGPITVKDQTSAPYRRLFNTNSIIYELRGGKVTRLSNFYSIAAVLNS